MRSIVVLFFVLFSCLPAFSFWEDFVDVPFDEHITRYPEDRNQKIDVKTVRSPLEYTDEEISLIEQTKEFFKGGLPSETEEIVSAVGFNKFSLGTGAVNVTYQVRKGVKYALKDTLAGFPEYERRKAVEEMLNSSLAAHKLTNQFLTGSSSAKSWHEELMDSIDLPFGVKFNWFSANSGPNLLVIAHKISKSDLIEKLHLLFERIAYILLVLFTSLIVFKRLSESSFNLGYSCAEPLMNAVFSAFLIGLSSFILDWSLKLLIAIQGLVNHAIDEFFVKEFKANTLAESWQSFVNQIGYTPSQVLCYIDVLAQCFVYFFLAGLILHIILGVVLSPLWSLSFVSNTLRSSSYESFISWLRTVTVTALIPVTYTLVKFISQEFSNYGYDFLEIVISIASYVYLPALANVVLARGTGIIQPVFSGYNIIADSINNSYNGLKNSIETLKT